jgi:hypothetical protein
MKFDNRTKFGIHHETFCQFNDNIFKGHFKIIDDVKYFIECINFEKRNNEIIKSEIIVKQNLEELCLERFKPNINDPKLSQFHICENDFKNLIPKDVLENHYKSKYVNYYLDKELSRSYIKNLDQNEFLNPSEKIIKTIEFIETPLVFQKHSTFPFEYNIKFVSTLKNITETIKL